MTKAINKSGVQPVEFKILVKPDKVETKTAGGILMPDDVNEREQWAQCKGTLVARGDAAFGTPFTEIEKAVLVPGARVYVRKYEGIVLEGADGEEYRLCADKDVGGVVVDEKAAATAKGRTPGALSRT